MRRIIVAKVIIAIVGQKWLYSSMKFRDHIFHFHKRKKSKLYGHGDVKQIPLVTTIQPKE